MTGGGSGGHITPLLAVATELKQRQPDAHIIYVAQRGDRFGTVVAEHTAIDETHRIFAGKFRRYHSEGWKQLLDVKTMALNIRDAFFVCIGILQSVWKLHRLRPDIIFIKGGFVGVPVGLAAALLKIPFVTHDSDALAGLANRIIARWAAAHAVALPTESYTYPRSKTVTVGVPIAAEYQPVSAYDKRAFREKIGIPSEARMLFVTGGGLGAQRINKAIVTVSATLLKEFPDLYIVHTTGHKHHVEISEQYSHVLSDPTELERVQTLDFTNELYAYSGAADVIVARAGATNMAEFAMQGRACVVVPNPVLAGGHQLKNATAYEAANAAVIVTETSLDNGADALKRALVQLLHSPETREKLEKNLHTFAHPDSAKELVNLLLAHQKVTAK